MDKFKNSSGVYLLRGLFFETTPADKTSVVYTLKDRDHEGYPSLKCLYLAISDFTEYRFATQCLGGLEHWDKLCECTWFQPYVEQWRRELDLKIKSEALARIMIEAERDSQVKFGANKYLLEKGWEPKSPSASKRGRPSKAEINEEAQKIVENNGRLIEDMERLGLRVVT